MVEFVISGFRIQFVDFGEFVIFEWILRNVVQHYGHMTTPRSRYDHGNRLINFAGGAYQPQNFKSIPSENQKLPTLPVRVV